MSDNAAATQPCAICNKPHVDRGRPYGWMNTNGYRLHAWRAEPAKTMGLVTALDLRKTRYDTSGTFGIAVVCNDCNDGRLVVNTVDGLRAHDAWHERGGR